MIKDRFISGIKKLKENKSGNVFMVVILISTFLAGFLWYSFERQQKKIRDQEDTISYQENYLFLNSFIGYLEKNSGNLTEGENLYFNGLSYNLSKEADKLEGFLNSGDSTIYSFNTPVDITIQWNKCISTAQQGAIQINADGVETEISADSSDNCSNQDFVFDESNDLTEVQSLVITAPDAPINYRIMSNDVNIKTLPDNKWHLSYKADLGENRKAIVGSKVFK